MNFGSFFYFARIRSIHNRKTKATRWAYIRKSSARFAVKSQPLTVEYFIETAVDSALSAIYRGLKSSFGRVSNRQFGSSVSTAYGSARRPSLFGDTVWPMIYNSLRHGRTCSFKWHQWSEIEWGAGERIAGWILVLLLFWTSCWFSSFKNSGWQGTKP